MSIPINIFIIYAREDKEIKQRLLLHLNPFKKVFNAVIWHDEHIEPGQEWKPHISSRLEQTDLFLLLVSIDFMNSEFINEVEFKYAIDRHREKKSIVIPVIINYCQWDIDIHFKEYTFNLKELQVLPNEGSPIGDWKTTEEAYNNIAAGIRTVLSTIKNNREQNQTQDEPELWQKPKQGILQKKYLLIGTGLVLVSFVIWFIFQMSSSKRDEVKKDISDEQAWNAAVQKNDTAAYKAYQAKFPQGHYVFMANQKIDSLLKKLKIGIYHQGGIIFYIDGTGKHGLIAATEDFPFVYDDWNKGISAGKQYRGGSYSDWRVPTKEELKLLYQEKELVGMDTCLYWSSTEHFTQPSQPTVRAWFQNFKNGEQNHAFKTPHPKKGRYIAKCNVRVIRTF